MSNHLAKKVSVLLFFDHFYPAYRSGGPARSSKALVEALGSLADIKVITRANDLGEEQILKGVQPNQWTNSLNVAIIYLLQKGFFKSFYRTLKETHADCCHFNSFFSFRFTIFPLLLVKLKILHCSKIILLPRGELAREALRIKERKKRSYLKFFKLLNLPISYHATTPQEKADIIREIGSVNVTVLPNLRSKTDFENRVYITPKKEQGRLRIVFIARIARIKNLEYCFKVLQRVRGQVTFDYYGVIEDHQYFAEMQALALKMPANIECSFRGPLSANDVIDTIAQYDALFFPSKTENFGHVILESLIASRPVIISDQTFWTGLEEKRAGWDLPLEDEDRFTETIDRLCILSQYEFEPYCKASFELAQKYFDNEEAINSYFKLYQAI